MKVSFVRAFVAFTLTVVSSITASEEPSIPRTLYHAKATVVVRPPTGVDPVAFVREYLPFFPKNDPAITVEQVGTTQPPQIELGFKDRDPQVAAERANAIAKALSATLNQKSTEPPIFGVSSFAEAPKEPATNALPPQERDLTAPSGLLERNKEYLLTVAPGLLRGFSGRATVITTPSSGWVRIEYLPIVSAPAGQPLPAQTKQQMWLNLAHVVAIQVASQPNQ
jgi:hypothetical protein